MKKHSAAAMAIALVVGILTAADCVLAQTWTGAGGMTWTQPDSNDFVPEYTNGATATFTSTGAGTVTIDAGGVTPGAVVVNSTANYTFSGGNIGGAGSLTAPLQNRSVESGFVGCGSRRQLKGEGVG
jgi:hypothetical protein